MASPSHQSPSVPERTGGHSAALQMRQRPLFLLMNSSHARVGSEGCTVVGVAFCTAGTLPGRSPRWPCARLFLWQTWSKCSDDKIVHVLFFPFFFSFFFPYSLSHLCSGKVIYSCCRLRAGGCQGPCSTATAVMCGV